jgi:DNA-binding NtrC family response regulator
MQPAPNISVLLVEDDASVATMMTRYLEATGFRAVVAASIEAAHALIRAERPDVVVTDIFLADGDGFSLIEALRAADPDLPIIAISGGRADFDVLAQAAKLGANFTIEKPFSPAYLVDTIDRCLEERTVR